MADLEVGVHIRIRRDLIFVSADLDPLWFWTLLG